MSNTGEADRKGKLTFEELRKYPGFELIEISDAEVVINNLYQLSLLFYEYYKSNISE
ncbi:hypothetical protein [Mucilaginibacter panaciglaebae]|uniref:Uncharacterized protein n=1 Tax=Mucilaginibacter panaciglaebae TaxID=502331 RepID=A0ABP7WZ29_9SPHI